MISADHMEQLPLNSGNGVDGLALRWAVRQRKTPKDWILWVSDLGVTGEGDNSSYDLLNDCADLCRKYNIAQVGDCDEALTLLADMKRTGILPRRTWSRDLASRIVSIENGTTTVVPVTVASV
mgnify:FL=1